MTAISGRTQEILDKVYADGHVSPQEIAEIRDHAKAMRDQLAELDGADSPIVSLLDRMSGLAEDLQEDMLIVRVADYSEPGRAQFFAASENYLALLRANFDAFKG